jgi:class 3 adenylate cyclase
MTPGQILCSVCGFANEPAVRFCGGCARPVARVASDGRSAPPAGVSAPEHLAQRILASRAAMEGERKLVTVMFVDVLGSTELIAGRDPEQAQAILDSVLREMVTAVHRYEGTVSQVLGDGFMAIFGAPIAHEDHAVRAACAALAIQDAVRNSANSAWRALGAEVQVRIGLNSGLVVIKAIENDLSIDYRAVGATTHIASRMEQIAPPGSIRLTRDTLRLAEGLVDAEPLGRIAIKGIAEPVEVCELKRMTPGGTRFRSRVTRGLTPLFGRAEELAVLMPALADAARGGVRSIVLHGEPGVGKSRLCYEVTRAEPAQPFRVLEAAAVSYSRSTPYSAIVTLLGQHFGITESESAGALGRRLQEGAAGSAALQGEHLAILQGLLDIPGENELWKSLEPVQRRQRVFAAVRALIREQCERQPVILLWEDLHWFDAESLEFVEALLREPPGRRLLMLLTSRDEKSDWQHPGTQHCHLRPLAPELTEAMLRNLISDAPELARLRALLTERTYGNPFFIEETVRALTESGVLVGSPGNYALREPNPAIDIPPTAEGLIAARIDALSPGAKALVQTAAVVGHEMAADVLRRVSRLDEADFAVRLATAVQSGLMYEVQHFPSTLCGFRHALNQEVAYGSLLTPQRKALHARVVEVFEEIYRERISEHVERLAEHSFRGEVWDKCVRYHIMAASRAATRFANHDAVQILDRGLSVVERLEPGRARAEAAIDLRLVGLAPLLPLGEHERVLSMLFEAEAAVATIDDPRRVAAIHSQISTALWMVGHHERARESAERALRIADEQNHFSLRLSAKFGLASARHALGDFRGCDQLLLELIDLLKGELELKRFGWASYPSVLSRTFLGSSLVFTGNFGPALAHLQRGRELADQTGHPYSRALIRMQLGHYHLTRGDATSAIAALNEATEIARKDEVLTMFAPVAGWLAAALTEVGRAEEAIETIEEAIETRGAVRTSGQYGRTYAMLGLARAYAGAGRFGDALSQAEQAVERTRASHEHVHHGLALQRLAAVQAQRGAPFFGDAESAFRKSLEHALAHGMRPLAAECHEGLGRLYAQQRRSADARRELEAGAALFADIKLTERAKSVREAVRLLA